MASLRSILVRFRVGGFGGIRGPTVEETIESLRVYGFPKELDGKIVKFLKEFRNHRNNKTNLYLADDAEHNLLILLRDWQKKRKERRENAVLSG